MSKKFDPDVMKFHMRRKLRWLELIAQHPSYTRKAMVFRLGIFIMKKFHTGLGYIEFSIKEAAKWLCVDDSQVVRARNLLVRHGWLRLVKSATLSRRTYSANRYDIAGGPEDYLLDDGPQLTVELTERSPTRA